MKSTRPVHRRSIRARLADLPGSLHRLTGLVASAGVNIVRLETLSWDHEDVWDDIELAADDEARLDLVVSTLQAEGLTVVTLPETWVMRDWAVEILESLGDVAGRDPVDALLGVVDAAQKLTNTTGALVLMEPQPPHPGVAGARWDLIRAAAMRFDPDQVGWSGDQMGVRIVASAMGAARASVPDAGRQDRTECAGAVVRIPAPWRRPAWLAVVGQRPGFLDSELKRLELFAQVSAPYVAPAMLGRLGA